MRATLVPFCLLVCSGCSFIFVRGPGDKLESTVTTRSDGSQTITQEPACTKSVAAPVVDTALAAFFAVVAISAASGSGQCTKTDSAGNKTAMDPAICGAIFAPVVIVEGTSATYGYWKTSKCRDAKERAREEAVKED